MIKIKTVKPSPHQGEYRVHLTLPLPTPALPGSGAERVVCCGLQVVSNNYLQLSTYNFQPGIGFDLSLSFSLIAQSKAPLENYFTNIGFGLGNRVVDFRFRMFNFGFIVYNLYF
jgi:hypothetical protein